jgi:hypothetical protein
MFPLVSSLRFLRLKFFRKSYTSFKHSLWTFLFIIIIINQTLKCQIIFSISKMSTFIIMNVMSHKLYLFNHSIKSWVFIEIIKTLKFRVSVHKMWKSEHSILWFWIKSIEKRPLRVVVIGFGIALILRSVKVIEILRVSWLMIH